MKNRPVLIRHKLLHSGTIVTGDDSAPGNEAAVYAFAPLPEDEDLLDEILETAAGITSDIRENTDVFIVLMHASE